MRIDSSLTLAEFGAAIALLATLVHAPLSAQGQLGWSFASASGPSARMEQGMAYDSLRARTVMFGGYGGG
jgi:hypothetical protein